MLKLTIFEVVHVFYTLVCERTLLCSVCVSLNLRQMRLWCSVGFFHLNNKWSVNMCSLS